MHLKHGFKHIIYINLYLTLAISSFSFNTLLQAGNKKRIKKYNKSHTELEQLKDLVKEPGFIGCFIQGALRQQFKKLIHKLDSSGFTLLHYAKTAEAVNFLIALGGDPNVRSTQGNKLTPLDTADNKEVAQALKKHGAKPSATSTGTQAIEAKTQAVSVLEQIATQLLKADKDSQTYKKLLKITRVLVYNGAKINSLNPLEVTLVQRAFYNGLIAACLTNDTGKARMKLNNFRSKEKQQAYLHERFCGFTPLQAGLSQDHHSIIELLIEYGAQADPEPKPTVQPPYRASLVKKETHSDSLTTLLRTPPTYLSCQSR